MMEENIKVGKGLEAQVECLRAEVAALQDQLKDKQKDITFHHRGEIKDAMLYLCGKRQDEGKELISKLKEEVGEMEEDLKRQTQMSGINLSSCITKTQQNSDNKLVQQLCAIGRCSDLAFQVEFQLTEVKEDQGSKRTISDLNVMMDTSDMHNFTSFVSGVEENRDLLQFFKTLRTFSDRCNDRCRTFQHFQEKFPSIVSLPGGSRSEVMSLSHPELPGCVLFIHWTVEVSKEGGVTPKIELLTKIPERALQLFPSWPVGGASESFQSLLRILGPEAALECVIRAVSLSSASA